MKCSHCGKKYPYRRRSVLVTHERMHTGELPFSCLHKGCDRRFSRKDCMMVHYHKHSIVHKCPIESCDMTFGSSMDLYRHKRFHRSECTICGTFFKTMTLLGEHKFRVHNESKIRCTVGRKFCVIGYHAVLYASALQKSY